MRETDHVALWAYKLARDVQDFLTEKGIALPMPWRDRLYLDASETLQSVRAYFRDAQPPPQETP